MGPAIGSPVHFVYGDRHVPATIIDPAFVIAHPESAGGGTSVTQALGVLSLDGGYFTTTAEHDAGGAPATWHWPEQVV